MERIAAERKKADRERIETEAAYRYELRKNLKPKDQQGYSKKKTQEDVLRDLLLATPKSEVEHTYESEEEEEKSTKDVLKEYVEKQKKVKDQQGYSKKLTQEEVYRLFGLWALP